MPLLATLGTVGLGSVPVSAEISANTTSISEEGGSVTFTVNATVPNGYVMYYVVIPVSGTVNSSSFTDSLMSGSFTINSNVGTIVKTAKIDSNNTGDVFKVEIRISSISGPKIAESADVTITDVLQNHVLKLTTTNIDDVNYGSIDTDPVDESYYTAGMTRISESNTNRVLRIFKFSKQGTLLWGRQVAFNLSGGTTTVNVGGVRVDGSRNVIAYCSTSSGTGNQRNLFLVKYNSSGTLQWQRNASDTTYNMRVDAESQCLSIDSSNNIYISASFSSTDYFSWVAKFNSSGTFQWQRFVSRSGTNGYDILSNGGCFADSAGNVYITVNGSVNRTDPEIGIVKYNTSGSIQWQRASVDPNNRSLSSIVGNDSTIIVGGRASISGTTRAILWAVTTSSGSTSWVRYSSAGTATFRHMSPRLDSSNDFYAYHDSTPSLFKISSGATLRWIRFWTPTTPPVSFAGSKVYSTGGFFEGYISIARFPNDGSGTGTYTAGGTNFTYANRSLTLSSTFLSNTAGTYTNNTFNLVTFSTSSFTSSSVTAVSAAVQGF
jgi:hypothetical protein